MIMTHKSLSGPETQQLLKLLQDCGPVVVLRMVASFVNNMVDDIAQAEELSSPILRQALKIQAAKVTDYK